jgi:hypothetical protein
METVQELRGRGTPAVESRYQATAIKFVTLDISVCVCMCVCVRASGLENYEYCRRDPLCCPRNTLYPQKLSVTSATSGGHSVGIGIVRSRTKATEFICLFVCVCVYVCVCVCERENCRAYSLLVSKCSIRSQYCIRPSWHTFSSFSCPQSCKNKQTKKKQTLWPESASELYRPSERHLSTNLVPNFADRGVAKSALRIACGSNLAFLDRSRYFSIK